MIIGQSQKIRVLVADRSSYARLVLENILTGDENIQLEGLAADGDELISLLKQKKPEVVLLNNSLPKNSRFFTLKRISSEIPTPVVLMIARKELALDFLQEALKAGVYAIVLKPEGKQLPDYRSVSNDILAKVKAVRHINFWDEQQRMKLVQHDVALLPEELPEIKDAVHIVVVIGASTGGTQAIEQIVKELAPNTGATFLVAVHLPASFTKAYTKRLQVLTSLPVQEGRHGMVLRPNKVIVAPGGRNMVVQQIIGRESSFRISFSDEPVAGFDQPSVDLLMQSVTKTEIKHIVGVILTGMGKDGTKGAGFIQEKGGIVIAQNQETSAIFGMAKSAIESGTIREVLPLSEIPHFINNYVEMKMQSVRVTDMTHEIERTGI